MALQCYRSLDSFLSFYIQSKGHYTFFVNTFNTLKAKSQRRYIFCQKCFRKNVFDPCFNVEIKVQKDVSIFITLYTYTQHLLIVHTYATHVQPPDLTLALVSIKSQVVYGCSFCLVSGTQKHLTYMWLLDKDFIIT